MHSRQSHAVPKKQPSKTGNAATQGTANTGTGVFSLELNKSQLRSSPTRLVSFVLMRGIPADLKSSSGDDNNVLHCARRDRPPRLVKAPAFTVIKIVCVCHQASMVNPPAAPGPPASQRPDAESLSQRVHAGGLMPSVLVNMAVDGKHLLWHLLLPQVGGQAPSFFHRVSGGSGLLLLHLHLLRVGFSCRDDLSRFVRQLTRRPEGFTADAIGRNVIQLRAPVGSHCNVCKDPNAASARASHRCQWRCW